VIYVVTNKLTGAEVTRYAASAPVEGAFPFADFTHAEFPDDTEPVIAQPLGQISKLAYMDRFADAELEGIYGAAKVSLAVEVWLEKFKLAEFIDLSDPRTLAGLQALEANGLIGPGRSLEILHG
jgi:hypothetical protein